MSKERMNQIAKEICELNKRIYDLTNQYKDICPHEKFDKIIIPWVSGSKLIGYTCVHCGKYFEFDSRHNNFDTNILYYEERVVRGEIFEGIVEVKEEL